MGRSNTDPTRLVAHVVSALALSPGDVLISRSALRHQPGREGRKAPKTYGHTAIPADFLWKNTVNKLFTAVTSSWTPAHGRPTVVGPTGRQGPSGRSPAVGTYEGWVTSYGVCGHLLDSLSAWGHSVTLFKTEQAHFGRFYGIMFFRKASPQTEGRRNAHHVIKT